MAIENIEDVKKGDLLILKDFHTLDAMGDEVTRDIVELHKWSNENLKMYGFEIAIDEDTKLMLVVRVIDGDLEARLMRVWDEGIADDLELPFDILDAELGNFQDFAVDPDDGDESINYAIKRPYPLWDMKKNDGEQVAICEFGTTDDDVGDDFWAKNCLMEWYAFVGENGEDGYLRILMGWDVGVNDFDFIKS